MMMEKKYHFDQLSKAKQKQYTRAVHASNSGRISSTELMEIMRATVFPDMTSKQILEAHVHPKPLPTVKLMQKLRKQGYQIIIFSNHQKTWPAQTIRNLKINIDGIPFVNSSLVGMTKPHLNYYNYLIKKYEIDPKAAVFIDDRAANLVPAKKLGIKTFHYQNNYSELVNYLRKLKIKGL